MKVLIALALAFALVFTLRTVAGADEDDATPKPTQFRPWQEVWQCNDIRLTVTGRAPFEIEYGLGGTIWGGSRFTIVERQLYFNGHPCLRLAAY